MHTDILIIGAGVSGLHLASLLDNCLLIEASSSCGKKLLASGGGKCNLSNANLSANRYLGPKEHYDRIFANKSAQDFLNIFKGVEFCCIKDSQYFAKDSKLILNHLLKAVKAKILTNCQALSINQQASGGFCVLSNKGPILANCVIVASGSSAYANLGSSDFALQVAKSFNIPYKNFSPALCALNLQPQDLWLAKLAGISLNVRISLANKDLKGGLVCTHKGIGGPVIYNASLWWQKGPLRINFAPDYDSTNVFKSHQELSRALNLPKRFANALLEHLGLIKKPLKAYLLAERGLLSKAIFAYDLAIAGRAGLNKAEIASGGIDPLAICENGCINKDGNLIKGLYFCGECLDFNGELGGFNISAALANAQWLASILNAR